MGAATRQFKKYLTAAGGADVKLYETIQDARAKADMYERQGLAAAKDWETASETFIKSAKLQNKTPVDAEKLKISLNNYLLGANTALDTYGDKSLIKAADKMIEVRSKLDDDIITQLEEAIGYKVNPDTEKRLLDTKTGRYQLQDPTTPAQIKASKALKEMTDAQNKQTGYLRRLFQQYTDPVSFYRNLDLTSKEFDDTVSEVAKNLVTGKGRPPNPNDLLQAKRIVYDSLGLQGLGGLPPEEALKNVRQSVIDKGKGKGFGLLAKKNLC